MYISYQKLTEKEPDTFIGMRIRQLAEEGAGEYADLKPALRDYYDRHMKDGTFVSWPAFCNNRTVGASGLSFVEKPPYFGYPNGKIGLLSSTYTSPPYRRHGIAGNLPARIAGEAKLFGCGTVQITASDMEGPLYASFGFERNANFMQYKIEPDSERR